jgi:hypothetical protein
VGGPCGCVAQRELWDPIPGHEVSDFALPRTPTVMYCSATGPRQHGQLIMNWNLQKLSQNKPFPFLSWLFQVFHYSEGELTAKTVFPTITLFFVSSPPILYFWENCHCVSLHLRGGCIYINYLEFLCIEHLSLLPFLFIYSIIYLCQYELPDVSTVYFLKDHFSPMGKTGKAAKHFHEQSGLGLVSSSSQECVKSSV